ncbi:MAG TPA: ABC transporter permease subunit [Microlunatus sp.]
MIALQIFSWEAARSMLPDLLAGLRVTVEVTVAAFLLSLVLGLIIAIPRTLKVPVLAPLLSFVVLFLRGTPLLVQAYFAFMVLPLVSGVTLSRSSPGSWCSG